MTEKYEFFLSDELVLLLKEIETESIVANLLLSRYIDKDLVVDNPVNYISISKADPTKISYLTQDRIRIIDPSEYWASSRRFLAKPGSFISKLFKNISPREIEKFSNLYRTQYLATKFTFEVVSGETIRKLYLYESNAANRGSLGASCMKGEICQTFFNIYVENDNNIKMLAMFDQDKKLMGRALLWDFGSNKIMDRIYTISDEELPFHFKKWADKNGYIHKSEQNWYDSVNFESVGKPKHELNLKIKLENINHIRYPYMDTFKFLDIENKHLYNYIPEDGIKFETLCGCDGSKMNKNYFKFDHIDRILRHSSEVIFVEYLKFFTHPNNTAWSSINNQYILLKDSIYNRDIDEHIFGPEYDNLNNKKLIEEKIERYKQPVKNNYHIFERRRSIFGLGEYVPTEPATPTAYQAYADITNSIDVFRTAQLGRDPQGNIEEIPDTL